MVRFDVLHVGLLLSASTGLFARSCMTSGIKVRHKLGYTMQTYSNTVEVAYVHKAATICLYSTVFDYCTVVAVDDDDADRMLQAGV
jgi:hypothetical protein